MGQKEPVVDQLYKVEKQPGKLFYVVAVDELEDCPSLERWLLENHYDGYSYMLQNKDDANDLLVCAKRIDGDFVQIK